MFVCFSSLVGDVYYVVHTTQAFIKQFCKFSSFVLQLKYYVWSTNFFILIAGIRGEVKVTVKVDFFVDSNKFRQSSCGVQFFYSESE